MPTRGRDLPGVGIKHDLVPVKALSLPMEITWTVKAIGIVNPRSQSSHVNMPEMIGPVLQRIQRNDLHGLRVVLPGKQQEFKMGCML
jgi:hypothetical protein